ncbi:aminotransferase class IV [Paraliomyxa miuraensis]|uniref:aminotransferase class IV n=1 Tax=Paraliomyxa miuraensis TaxID=376150 RepID=UPI0022551774|nr:aminotransferase class IV [Paraliomyxa miuraensis]MCX4243100.1 aminotransferase class IV [Paraliomyxa miuraensis]
MVERAHESLWVDGRFVPTAEAAVGLFTHSLHYGTAVFDGCRFRRAASGRIVAFRLFEHIGRFVAGARTMFMALPYDRDALGAACVATIARSGVDEGYLRMLAWYGDDAIGIGAHNRAHVALLSWDPPPAAREPVRLRVAGFGHDARWLPGVKLAGQYARSFLARGEAERTGCDDALFLGPDGTVAEATGANVMVVQRGHLRTPPPSAPILRGITRDTVLTLAREHGHPSSEVSLRRDDLLEADEILLTNSSLGITPVGAFEGRTLDAPGPMTRALVRAYRDVVCGDDPRHLDWLTEIP